ncbi:hypothetical protein JTE90_005227, partial [Oedothorax gibbosus]
TLGPEPVSCGKSSTPFSKNPKVKRIKGAPAFAVRIHTENSDQASFWPFCSTEFFLSSLSSPWEHLALPFDDVPPQAKRTHLNLVLVADRCATRMQRAGLEALILRIAFRLNRVTRAVHLGDLLRILVTDRPENYHLLGFQGPTERTGHRNRRDFSPSLRLSLESLLLPTKICTGGGSRRAHARHLNASPPRPSYSLSA